MICAVHQPQYLPWLGFFSKWDAADVFIIYDDTQYKHREWQNRNRIKGPGGPQWLTVPVHASGRKPIREVAIDNGTPWARRHARAIARCYARAPFFKTPDAANLWDELEAVLAARWDRLAELNIELASRLARRLGIGTRTVIASELNYEGRATDALVSMCKKIGADAYLSGPGGRNYLQEDRFRSAGLTLLFHDYDHPEYPQQFGDFVPHLSVIDLLFNCGPDSLDILRTGRRIAPCEDGS